MRMGVYMFMCEVVYIYMLYMLYVKTTVAPHLSFLREVNKYIILLSNIHMICVFHLFINSREVYVNRRNGWCMLS